MYTAKFLGGFNPEEPIILYYIVSKGNERQTGAAFLAFVNLVKQHKQHIKEVKIVTTGWLHRHYAIDFENFKSEWMKTNQEHLKVFDQQNVLYDVTDLRDLPSYKSEYVDALATVEKHYNENAVFKLKIDDLAKKHEQKANLEAAKKYAIEDAATGLIIHGHAAYPGDNLNLAIQHVVEKFNGDLQYHGYMLNEVNEEKLKKQLDDNFSASARLLEKLGLLSDDKKIAYFRHFLFLNGKNTPIKAKVEVEVEEEVIVENLSMEIISGKSPKPITISLH